MALRLCLLALRASTASFLGAAAAIVNGVEGRGELRNDPCGRIGLGRWGRAIVEAAQGRSTRVRCVLGASKKRYG
jgi:hypothetical protein